MRISRPLGYHSNRWRKRGRTTSGERTGQLVLSVPISDAPSGILIGSGAAAPGVLFSPGLGLHPDWFADFRVSGQPFTDRSREQ